METTTTTISHKRAVERFSEAYWLMQTHGWKPVMAVAGALYYADEITLEELKQFDGLTPDEADYIARCR
jgi:hypothetical protein